jgi:hypothetical protein
VRGLTRGNRPSRDTVWFQACVAGITTPDEARRALAARPATFDKWQLHDDNTQHFGVLGWDALGHAHHLAGDSGEALALLEAVQRSCTLAVYPMSHVRSFLELGEIYEAGGDKTKACGAYREVLRFWGLASPGSVTAARARKRLAGLGCEAP